MGSKNVSYTYDVTGIRSSKTVGSTVHRYVTQSGRVVRETYGARVLDFIYGTDGRPFAVKYSADSGATFTTYYYVLNVQGDVMGLLNSNGTLIVKYTYDAWGKVLSVTNANGTPLPSSANIANINPLRYRSYYYDTETGFYYLQSRYYDPALGRFINADSFASTGQGFLGYNMFAYCGNNSILYIDIRGCYKVAIIGDDTLSFHNGWGLDFASCIDYYIDCYGSDNVDVVSFQTAEEFVDGWNSLDNEYDAIIIYAHGSKSTSALWFQTNNEYLRISSNKGEHTFSELKQIQVHSNVKMNVCYAAKKINDTSTAEVFANKTNCKVHASTSKVTTYWIYGLSYSNGWQYVYPAQNANGFTPHATGSSRFTNGVMNCLY